MAIRPVSRPVDDIVLTQAVRRISANWRLFRQMIEKVGGPGRTRTGTPCREADFKSAVSANSTTGPCASRAGWMIRRTRIAA